jgi:hypothetical protein
MGSDGIAEGATGRSDLLRNFGTRDALNSESEMEQILFLLLVPVPPAGHPAPVGGNPFGAGRRRRGKR